MMESVSCTILDNYIASRLLVWCSKLRIVLTGLVLTLREYRVSWQQNSHRILFCSWKVLAMRVLVSCLMWNISHWYGSSRCTNIQDWTVSPSLISCSSTSGKNRRLLFWPRDVMAIRIEWVSWSLFWCKFALLAYGRCYKIFDWCCPNSSTFYITRRGLPSTVLPIREDVYPGLVVWYNKVIITGMVDVAKLLDRSGSHSFFSRNCRFIEHSAMIDEYFGLSIVRTMS